MWWLTFLGQVAVKSVVLSMISRVGKLCLISQRGEGCGSKISESEVCVHMWTRNWLFLGRVF